MSSPSKYIQGYPPELIEQVTRLHQEGKLSGHIHKKYPESHSVHSNKQLHEFVHDIKNDYMKRSSPIHKVEYHKGVDLVGALGTHTHRKIQHGQKLKSRAEVRISPLLKEAPLELMRMVVVHEIAHLVEKDHNKAFYQLCEHMEPDYHQMEFDLRLWLVSREAIV